MNAFALWLRTPFPERYFAACIIGGGFLVSGIWLLIPLLTESLDWKYLALPLTPRNIVLAVGDSFGEELIFRTFPILAILAVCPTRTVSAFIAGLVGAYFFGTWHGWSQVAETCLATGGVILAIIYLKSGGAVGRPFRGLMACGSIHAIFNLSVTVLAHIVVDAA